jgi:molecular chaperone DnaK (HSP70)
MEGLPT